MKKCGQILVIYILLIFYISFWYASQHKFQENNNVVLKFSDFQTTTTTGALSYSVKIKNYEQKLTTEFEEISKVAKNVYENTGNHVYFTLINSAYVNLTKNWLCNTASMGNTHKRTFIVCSDKETCNSLNFQWPNATFYGIELSDIITSSSMYWGQKSYVSFLTFRVHILKHLVKSKIPVILFETDAIWFRDPGDYFQNFSKDGDIIIPIKGYADHGLTLTFDPMVVNPTPASYSLFNEMTKRLVKNPNLFDQDLLDNLCKQQFSGVMCTTFPWDDIADGLWFKLSKEMQKKLSPYIVNNNYYVGVNNKITRQALNGMWFLNVKNDCDFRRTSQFLNKIY